MSTHPFEGPRGLVGFTEFADTYGNMVRVQESSAVEVIGQGGSAVSLEPGPSSHCWLRIEGSKSSASAHLDTQMATELILALAEFIGRSARLGDSGA
jgi:hypothetical protein